MAQKGDVFNARDTALVTGSYHVIHDKLDGDDHAQTHRVIVRIGERFPESVGCHGSVRFQLDRPEEHVADSEHFRW